jgi:hypothetical protein
MLVQRIDESFFWLDALQSQCNMNPGHGHHIDTDAGLDYQLGVVLAGK